MRNCKACGEPCENGLYWCSDACWRDEDGGWDDGPAERQALARREGYRGGVQGVRL